MKKCGPVSLGLVMLVVLATMVTWLCFRNSAENEYVRVTWRAFGQPLVVCGKITHASGQPIPNIALDLVNDSGGDLVVSDENGEFSQQMGEVDLLAIDLQSKGSIEFFGPFGISAERGLWLEIVVKDAE